MVLSPLRQSVAPAPQVATVAATGDDSVDAEFAHIFTPTVDEDTLI